MNGPVQRHDLRVELRAEVDPDGRIRSCSPSLVEFVQARRADELIGATLDELAVTGPRRTLGRALRDAGDFDVEVGPVDLWLQVSESRIQIGRFWVRPAGPDGFEVRGEDLARFDRPGRRAALESLLLGWLATGVRGEQVLRGLAQLVEWNLPGTRCAVGVVDDTGSIHTVAAPTLSAGLPDRLQGLPPEVFAPAAHRGMSCVDVTDLAAVDGLIGVAVHEAEAASLWIVHIEGLAEEHLGLLAVYVRPDTGLDGEDLSFLRHVSDVAAASIARDRGDLETLHRSLHDPLTGLPNRRKLIDELDEAVVAHRLGGSRVAALMVDLDEFKVVNESLSHKAGDEVLIHVAQRLLALGGPIRITGRLGGDEFLAVTAVGNAGDAVEVAERVRRDLHDAVRVGDTYVRTSVSVGVAVAGPDDDAKTLLRDADAALHRAKEAGRNRVVLFDPALRMQVLERVETETALRRGLARKELEVHFQPIVQLDPGRPVGAEALVRWRRDGVLLGPNEFVPAAESGGLIEQVGVEVLEASAELVAELRAGGYPSMTVSVNVSPHELNDRLVPNVRSILRNAGLPPDALCVEITESALVWEGAEHVIRDLATTGVGIAVDDFGTGYSSLNHLRRFPMATALKIDGTFVADLQGPAPSGQAIVSAAILLGHSLGMKVTAERVETQAQLQLLREMACDRVQGFLLGHPVPGDELADVLDEVVGRIPPS